MGSEMCIRDRLHGEAGEVCARAIGEYGMTPTDVIAALPAVIEEHVS